MTLMSAGTEAGVFIDALGPSDCLVRVITLRRIATNAFTELGEDSFHERFSAFLLAPGPRD